jgi:CheY-like chemotaxis protein
MGALRCTALRDLRILVVEPHDDSRELLAFVLTECGAAVWAVNSTRLALDAMDVASPDLLVAELGLPNEDRYELINAVRGRAPSQGGTVIAVAFTSFAGSFDRQQSIREGFDLHLAKPLTVDAVLEELGALVQARRLVRVASRDSPVHF